MLDDQIERLAKWLRRKIDERFPPDPPPPPLALASPLVRPARAVTVAQLLA
jgi:hypothetical protein